MGLSFGWLGLAVRLGLVVVYRIVAGQRCALSLLWASPRGGQIDYRSAAISWAASDGDISVCAMNLLFVGAGRNGLPVWGAMKVGRRRLGFGLGIA